MSDWSDAMHGSPSVSSTELVKPVTMKMRSGVAISIAASVIAAAGAAQSRLNALFDAPSARPPMMRNSVADKLVTKRTRRRRTSAGFFSMRCLVCWPISTRERVCSCAERAPGIHLRQMSGAWRWSLDEVLGCRDCAFQRCPTNEYEEGRDHEHEECHDHVGQGLSRHQCYSTPDREYGEHRCYDREYGIGEELSHEDSRVEDWRSIFPMLRSLSDGEYWHKKRIPSKRMRWCEEAVRAVYPDW